MATRYSGRVKVSLNWDDEKQQYKTTVSWPSGGRTRRKPIWVGAPGVLTKAVDSSVAYDEAAAAAISFASEEDPEVGELADYTDKGLFVSRKKTARHR